VCGWRGGCGPRISSRADRCCRQSVTYINASSPSCAIDGLPARPAAPAPCAGWRRPVSTNHLVVSSARPRWSCSSASRRPGRQLATCTCYARSCTLTSSSYGAAIEAVGVSELKAWRRTGSAERWRGTSRAWKSSRHVWTLRIGTVTNYRRPLFDSISSYSLIHLSTLPSLSAFHIKRRYTAIEDPG
jgi:hypothetical protein